MRGAVVTVSTSRSAGGASDDSGPLLAELVRGLGLELAGSEVVADDRAAIAACLRRWCDDERCELVLTSGGTGLSPDDVTPEATLDVLDRQVPGIAEAMRLASRSHTPHWMLSRAVAGTRGRTLLVNLPGHPRAVRQVTDELLPALRHGLDLLAGAHGRHE